MSRPVPSPIRTGDRHPSVALGARSVENRAPCEPAPEEHSMSDAFTLKTPTQEPDLPTAMQVIYQWNYDPEVEELRNLYVKAAEAQWIGAKDLAWNREIDLVKFSTTPIGAGVPIEKTSYWRSLTEETRAELVRRTAAV